ncbi:RNA-binding S4 domain-containing protein [Vibrio pacinii]|uniref:RNA-binding S4 domain-containing protein n=1 Tax=Vibrio pacinii TaxID=170674 RepID=UPI000571E644|nr:RNA-binding S4 domain-containing protein [Vibrio pacinii]
MSEDHQQGEEIEIEAIGIEVSSQPIELYKVFKIANLVGGGGEAKHLIAEGYVAVNGELETRKRRKLYDGDFFEFNQEYYVVVCDVPVSETSDKTQTSTSVETQPTKHVETQPAKHEPKNVVSDEEPASSLNKKKGKGRASIDFF